MATQAIAAYDLKYGSRRNSQQVAERNLYLFAAQQRAQKFFAVSGWTILAW
jgi:hypothetical protein